MPPVPLRHVFVCMYVCKLYTFETNCTHANTFYYTLLYYTLSLFLHSFHYLFHVSFCAFAYLEECLIKDVRVKLECVSS